MLLDKMVIHFSIYFLISLCYFFSSFVWQFGRISLCSLLVAVNFWLSLSLRRSLSYRNQSTDLFSKSIDCFLYDKDLGHEKVTETLLLLLKLYIQLLFGLSQCSTQKKASIRIFTIKVYESYPW